MLMMVRGIPTTKRMRRTVRDLGEGRDGGREGKMEGDDVRGRRKDKAGIKRDNGMMPSLY